jgi:hypothetical protein
VNTDFLPSLRAVLFLLAALFTTSAVHAVAPKITRTYRVLHCGQVGEFPDPNNPAHHPPPPKKPRTDPSSLINVGCLIDLRVTATGEGLTYQWRKGNVNIPGATSAELVIPVTSLNDAGSYRCQVTNDAGQSVLTKPIHMAALSVASSSYFVAAAPTATTTFSVDYKFPTATGLFEFQWFRMRGETMDYAAGNVAPEERDELISDGGAYSGAKKATLKVKVTNGDVAGSYYCRVIAYKTSMRTGLRHLAVVPSPQPTMVQLNAPMEFSVSPVGPAQLLDGLTYQWLKDGAEIPDAAASSYSVASAGAGDAGQYSVAVTHPTLGTVTSPQVTGLVIDPPVTQVLAIETGNAALMAPPPVGTAQTYKWYLNGSPVADGGRYSGAVKATLSIKAVTVADAGEYECRGTLYGNTVVVARPVLIVLPAPLSQVAALGGGFELTGSPEFKGSEGVDADVFSYQWIKGSGASATLLDGEIASSYTVASASLTDVGDYALRLGYPGATSVTSKLASVTVVDTTPQVVNANAGKTIKLKPVYTGKGVSFQWRRGGVALAESAHHVGVTKNTLSIVGVTLADAGDDYDCLISYPGGASVAAPFEVVVFSAPDILDFELPEMMIGRAASYQITCSPDPLYAPQSYDAKLVVSGNKTTSLPKGLSIDKATGILSGTPTVAGNFVIRAIVKNAVGETTADSPLVIHGLPEHLLGRYTGPLPRMPNGEFCDRGGRFDMTVTSTASFSGKLTIGNTSHSFKGVMSLDSANPLTATGSAEIVVARSGGDLVLAFDLGTDHYLSNGVITGAGNTVAFTGWRNVYSVANPPTAYAGRYNIGLVPAEPEPPATTADLPQGISYASLLIENAPSTDAVAGNYTFAGQLADGTSKITVAAFVGPAGELLFYQPLYTAAGVGSLVGSELAIDAETAERPLTGEVSWTRPANVSPRRYPAGFAPLELTVVGGRYEAGDRLLGATQANLSMHDGGIELASINPDALFDIGLGNNLPVLNGPSAASTAIKKVNLELGTFEGDFKLADDNPTTPTVKATEYKRTVKFYGLVVPLETGLTGMGYFVMPQIPTVNPPTTTANSPELSGSVLLEAVE